MIEYILSLIIYVLQPEGVETNIIPPPPPARLETPKIAPRITPTDYNTCTDGDKILPATLCPEKN